MNDMARSLEVDLGELCIALADDGDLAWFFDLHTGEVILVNHEYDPAEFGGLTVEEIKAAPGRFVRVPPSNPQVLMSDMRAWVSGLSDGRLKETLNLALEAQGPDRRFKAVLSWLPQLQEQWRVFRHQRSEQRARNWLAEQGVRADLRAVGHGG